VQRDTSRGEGFLPLVYFAGGGGEKKNLFFLLGNAAEGGEGKGSGAVPTVLGGKKGEGSCGWTSFWEKGGEAKMTVGF